MIVIQNDSLVTYTYRSMTTISRLAVRVKGTIVDLL